MKNYIEFCLLKFLFLFLSSHIKYKYNDEVTVIIAQDIKNPIKDFFKIF